MHQLNWEEINGIIERALSEDIGSGDVTAMAMKIDRDAEAHIVSKEQGVLAGIAVAEHVFRKLDPGADIHTLKKDGEQLSAGERILRISAKGNSILRAERTALNILGRMCGIATLAKTYAERAKGTGCRIFDTRKTMPNLRVLDKYAVTCGGAENHRYGLYDMILIKENHIRWAGGIKKALQSAVRFAETRDLRVEVEVTNIDEYKKALQFPVDMIMLDHFSLQDLQTAVGTDHGSVLLEASGNVNLQRVRSIAETGVDIISVGELTHSVKSHDLSLLFHVSR
ncbi:MAG: carboxylating nicotinate-nucleotide diphosphorylase [Candidatus Marinimicrobia bacterium]|nr:carboxylating nicotinate-nucleotide diphosphorylase [Candidatus Neomarinimicrobiota bacterium]